MTASTRNDRTRLDAGATVSDDRPSSGSAREAIQRHTRPNAVTRFPFGGLGRTGRLPSVPRAIPPLAPRWHSRSGLASVLGARTGTSKDAWDARIGTVRSITTSAFLAELMLALVARRPICGLVIPVSCSGQAMVVFCVEAKPGSVRCVLECIGCRYDFSFFANGRQPSAERLLLLRQSKSTTHTTRGWRTPLWPADLPCDYKGFCGLW